MIDELHTREGRYTATRMEYKERLGENDPEFQFEPRLIIHGGAGNIPSRDKMPAETYAAYRHSLLTIVCYNSCIYIMFPFCGAGGFNY